MLKNKAGHLLILVVRHDMDIEKIVNLFWAKKIMVGGWHHKYFLAVILPKYIKHKAVKIFIRYFYPTSTDKKWLFLFIHCKQRSYVF